MNIQPMLVTLAVLKLLRSRLVKLEQSRNMVFMLVTLAVLKLLTLRLVIAEQP